MEIRVGVGAVALGGLLRLAQTLRDRVVDDEPKFLLRDVRLGPHLAFLRQEHAADQRRQLLVVRGHLLQRRIGIVKAQRAGAALVRAVRMNFGVNAPVHRVAENVGLEKFRCRVVVALSALTISRGSQCSCLCIQPVVPAVKDGVPFFVRG